MLQTLGATKSSGRDVNPRPNITTPSIPSNPNRQRNDNAQREEGGQTCTITPGRMERKPSEGATPSTCMTKRIRTISINQTWIFLCRPKFRDFLADSVNSPDRFKVSNIANATAPTQSVRLGSRRLGRSRNPCMTRKTVTTIDIAECIPPHLKITD